MIVFNIDFVRAFMEEDTNCATIGVVEHGGIEKPFFALKVDDDVPPDVMDRGLNLGQRLVGKKGFEVVQFVFEFYDFEKYDIFLNPSNEIVRHVLNRMIDVREQFIFLFYGEGKMMAYMDKVTIHKDSVLQGEYIETIMSSMLTENEYEILLDQLEENPVPLVHGKMLDWVLRDDKAFLDLTNKEKRMPIQRQ